MQNSTQPKILDIIKSIIGNRIIDFNHSKFCKNTKIHKNIVVNTYQLIGFKLIGLDDQIHCKDYVYYQNYSYDIKDLQKKLSDAFKVANYDIKQIILQPCSANDNWSLSFTITTEEQKMRHEAKYMHAKCFKT